MIQWSDSLKLGIQEIDSQHRQLIDIVNGFLAQCMIEPDKVAIKAALARLREYTVYHFHSEEAYMASIGYDRLDIQKTGHAGIIKALKEYQRMMFNGRQIDAAEFKSFISTWLVSHILKEDMLIKTHGGGDKAPPSDQA